jgi:5-formyltetrahydrofolate cyclo-ligase
MKATLRKRLRAARRALSAAEHRSRSGLAARAIMRLPTFAAGKRVALYLPFDGEIDTAKLLAAARARGVHVFIPVISDKRHGRLRFYPLKGATTPGVFGIAVPRRMARPVAAQWLNLIVAPLVGVDAKGRRLGMGGGYYDRALAFRQRRRYWKGPRVVGFAFDCQRAELEFADPWDVRLSSLATESGLQQFLEQST